MSRAIGMIETHGLIGSIVAADTMLKAAGVRLVKQEKIDAGLVTVIIEGDVGAVQAAIEAGGIAATRVGELVSSHVIPHPDEGVAKILQKEDDKKEAKVKSNLQKPEPKPSTLNKEKHNKDKSK